MLSSLRSAADVTRVVLHVLCATIYLCPYTLIQDMSSGFSQKSIFLVAFQTWNLSLLNLLPLLTTDVEQKQNKNTLELFKHILKVKIHTVVILRAFFIRHDRGSQSSTTAVIGTM